MNYQKNSLTAILLRRVALIFVLVIVLFGVFYRFAFPTYYYWKLEQPVKAAQQGIEAGESYLDEDVITVTQENYQELSNDDINSNLLFQLNQAGISLNTFWLDETTMNRLNEGAAVQRLFNQKQLKSDFYAIFFIHEGQLYVVGSSIPNFSEVVGILMPLILVATLLLLVLLVGLMILVVRKQLIQPIGDLEKATSNISELNFSGEDVKLDNELGALSQSVNQMKSALKRHEDELLNRNARLKDFSSNLAHELKTPLSVMQLLVDGEKYGLENETFLPELDAKITEMNQLIQRLLAFSRQEKLAEPTTIPIKDFILAQVQQQQILAPYFQFAVKVEATTLIVDEELLQLVLGNLLTNALKYSVDQQLEITGERSLDHYYLHFKNRASHFSETQLAQLKEPFVVGEASRNNHLSGTGLGLSLVEQAMQQLNGKLILQQEEGFFIATLQLPLF